MTQPEQGDAAAQGGETAPANEEMTTAPQEGDAAAQGGETPPESEAAGDAQQVGDGRFLPNTFAGLPQRFPH